MYGASRDENYQEIIDRSTSNQYQDFTYRWTKKSPKIWYVSIVSTWPYLSLIGTDRPIKYARGCYSSVGHSYSFKPIIKIEEHCAETSRGSNYIPWIVILAKEPFEKSFFSQALHLIPFITI